MIDSKRKKKYSAVFGFPDGNEKIKKEEDEKELNLEMIRKDIERLYL